MKISIKKTAELLLYAYILCLPIAAIKYARIADLVFIILSIFALLILIRSGNIFEYLSKPALFFTISFVILIYGVSVFSVFRSEAFRSCFTILQLLGLLLCVHIVANSPEVINKCISALLLNGFIIVGGVLFFYGWNGFISLINSGSRVGAEFINENLVGKQCAVSAVLMYIRFIQNKKMKYIIGIAIMSVFVLASASRASLVLMCVGLFLCNFIIKERNKLITSIFIVGIAVLLYIGLKSSGYFSSAVNRFDQLMNIFGNSEAVDGSTRVRKEMIDYGLQLLKDKPIFGYGLGQFRFFYFEYSGWNLSPHTTFTQITVSIGSFGFLFWYGFLGCICRALWKSGDYVFKTILVIFLMQFVMDFISAQAMTSKEMYVYWGLGFSAYKMIKDISKTKQPEPVQRIMDYQIKVR